MKYVAPIKLHIYVSFIGSLRGLNALTLIVSQRNYVLFKSFQYKILVVEKLQFFVS